MIDGRLSRTAALALALSLMLAAAPTLPVLAQGAEVAFGGLSTDTSLPVEIAADGLQVSQKEGTAVFTGNVIASQGEMRLSAARVEVRYKVVDGKPGNRPERLLATGGVTFVNGPDAAEGEMADYDIDQGIVVLTGNVILTQGQSAMAAEKMVINLKTGTGVFEGRVRTILQTEADN